MLTAALIIGILILITILILNFYPALGGKPSLANQKRIQQLPNFSKGKFVNLIPTSMNMGAKEMLKVMVQFLKGNPQGKPRRPLTAESVEGSQFIPNNQDKIIWFGHSAVLMEMSGKVIFIDPMLGRAPSPFPIFGGKRFSANLPLSIEQLPSIDIVLLSHDHYDHLDYGSIKQMKSKVKRFIVPLGVATHLERWGVEPERIQEHNWWDEFEVEGLRFACTPARHFSGRGVTGRDSTLWCSWVINGGESNVFFSGDSGYGPHFQQIGDKYGPFNLTLMECGQYDERWSAIHMLPEETVQAHLDVKGQVMVPIHWGAFVLALHDWTDPVERAVKEGEQRNASICTPRIGEPVLIGSPSYPKSAWWQQTAVK